MKIRVLFIFLLIRFFLTGQNLVPNPSFETINAPPDTLWGGCVLPTGGFNLGMVPPWDSPSNGNPDPFNVCSHPVSSSSVPLNVWGYQQPHTGGGYAAEVFYFHAGNSREYIQVELNSPLVAKADYCASYYISHTNSSIISCNNFGMYFSSTHIYSAIQSNLIFTPQINDTNIVSDTLNWNLIYGKFTALGGERYLIIGNFYNNAQTDTVQNNGTDNSAYYYIDDVNVHCCSCDSLDHTGIEEGVIEEGIKLYPNPANDKITIEILQNKMNNSQLEITNVLGQLVYSSIITNTTSSIDISTYPIGVYFLLVKDKEKSINRKFVKE